MNRSMNTSKRKSPLPRKERKSRNQIRNFHFDSSMHSQNRQAWMGHISKQNRITRRRDFDFPNDDPTFLYRMDSEKGMDNIQEGLHTSRKEEAPCKLKQQPSL